MIHVLVVEDTPDLLPDLKSSVGDNDWNRAVWVARNAEQAKNILQRKWFDIVISDMAMDEGPEAGLLVIEEARKKDQDTWIIVVTSYGTRENELKAMAKGANEYIDRTNTKTNFMTQIRKRSREIAEKKAICLQAHCPPFDHPVHRLLPILIDMNQCDDGMNARDAYLSCLNLEDGGSEELLESLGKLAGLVDAAGERLREKFQNSDSQHMQELKEFSQVIRSSFFNLMLDWGKTKPKIPPVLRTLEIAKGFLRDAEQSEHHREDAELKELQDLLRQLLDKVKASKVDQRVKAYLLDSLQRAEKGVRMYRKFGYKGFESQVKLALFDLKAHAPEIKEASAGDGARSGDLMVAIDKLYKTALSMKLLFPIATKIVGFFHHMGDDSIPMPPFDSIDSQDRIA